MQNIGSIFLLILIVAIAATIMVARVHFEFDWAPALACGAITGLVLIACVFGILCILPRPPGLT